MSVREKIQAEVEGLDWSKDQGMEKPKDALSEGDRKMVAFHMAAISSFGQLIQEGVISEAQYLHFMLHLQDFAGKLYSGQTLETKNTSIAGAPGAVNQSLRVDSELGRVFAAVSQAILDRGGRATHDEEGVRDEEVKINLPEPDADFTVDFNREQFQNLTGKKAN